MWCMEATEKLKGLNTPYYLRGTGMVASICTFRPNLGRVTIGRLSIKLCSEIEVSDRLGMFGVNPPDMPHHSTLRSSSLHSFHLHHHLNDH